MTSVADTARATVAAHDLALDEGPLVVMVSGGADSVALLRLLAAGTFGDVDAVVLHVDHRLRGAESETDAEFVAALCGDLAIECRVERVDVAAWASERDANLEDAGRIVRYSLAEQLLRERRTSRTGRDSDSAPATNAAGGGAIVTAHTLDDRIETFFARALTGAGAGALAGIPYRRGAIVRPLLDVARADLRAYLSEIGQVWREDASNADTTRQRAAVRHELLPAAERVAPGFRSTMQRTLGLLADDDELLSEMASAFARDFTDLTDGRLSFSREMMATLSPAMARRTVRAALLDAFPEAARMPSEHIEALAAGVHDAPWSRDLPYGLRAESEYDRLSVFKRGVDTDPAVEPALLPVPGSAGLGAAGEIVAERVEPSDLAGDRASVVVDADALGTLAVTAVREGDRMRPLGMVGTKKLSDLLVDEKVPRRLRGAVPVVRDGDRIVWLAGVRMSEEYRVGPDTTTAVRLTWNGDVSNETTAEG